MGVHDAPRRLALALALLARLGGEVRTAPAELAAQLGVDESELDELISFVMMCGLPPYSPDVLIDIDVDVRGIALRQAPGDALLRPARLTLGEADALRSALSVLLQRLGRGASGALGSVCAKVDGSLAETATGRQPSHTVAAAIPGAEDPSVLAALLAAAEDARSADIEYWSATSDNLSARRVDPVGLMNRGGTFYMVAFCHTTGEERVFRVDRVRKARVTDERFERPTEEPDLAQRADGSFVLRDGIGVAEVSFTGVAARLATEAWPDAEVREDDEKTVVHIPYASVDWLVRELLPYGPEARVLAPDDVVRAYRDMVRELASRYRSG